MGGEPERQALRFEPLHPASRGQLVAAVVFGPILWLVALVVVAAVLKYTRMIAVALFVTAASLLVALALLAVLHVARRRQEDRYADRG